MFLLLTHFATFGGPALVALSASFKGSFVDSFSCSFGLLELNAAIADAVPVRFAFQAGTADDEDSTEAVRAAEGAPDTVRAIEGAPVEVGLDPSRSLHPPVAPIFETPARYTEGPAAATGGALNLSSISNSFCRCLRACSFSFFSFSA